MSEFTELIDDCTNDSGYVHIPKALLIDAVCRLLGEPPIFIKDCLSCANSSSEDGDELGDFLHCSLKEGKIVEDDGYCDGWNG